MKLNPEIWGPHYWFFLHSMAFNYPSTPNDTIRKKYYEVLHNFDLFIPHRDVAKYYRHLINKYPLKPYLDSKEALVKWVWYIHNKVNTKLEKKTFTLQEFYEDYYRQYKKKNDTFILHYAKYAVIIAFVILFFYFVYIYYEPIGHRRV
jgi:hypothetical protein